MTKLQNVVNFSASNTGYLVVGCSWTVRETRDAGDTGGRDGQTEPQISARAAEYTKVDGDL